jgi:hypothetical protein
MQSLGLKPYLLIRETIVFIAKSAEKPRPSGRGVNADGRLGEYSPNEQHALRFSTGCSSANLMAACPRNRPKL